jgi:hypothetical protein
MQQFWFSTPLSVVICKWNTNIERLPQSRDGSRYARKLNVVGTCEKSWRKGDSAPSGDTVCNIAPVMGAHNIKTQGTRAKKATDRHGHDARNNVASKAHGISVPSKVAKMHARERQISCDGLVGR